MRYTPKVKQHNLKQHFTDFKSVYATQILFNGGFYGLRAIFVLYAINQFFLKETQAVHLFAIFMMLCYGTSLLGGYMADKGLGVKKTIMLGGFLSSLGLLCVLSPSIDFMFLGLALTSLGSGYSKPNLLTAVGMLFENPKDPEKDKVYSFLFTAACLGNCIAPLICGLVGKTYGWQYGIMLLAVVFMGSTYFVYKHMHFHPSHKEESSLSSWTLYGSNLALIIFLYLVFKYQESFHSLMGIITVGSIAYLGKIFYQCNSQERKDVLTIIAYLLLFVFCCALVEQAGTSLMLFYEKAVNRQVMGTVIPSATLLSLDSLFILFCSPLLFLLCRRYFEKTKPMNGFIKMGIGFLCFALSFGILALSTYQENGSSIPLIWIVGVLFIQAIGGCWITPVSISKISQHAPPRFKGILMSFWPMAIAYGHYLAGSVAQLSVSDMTPLAVGNPLEGYRTFFMHLASLPLCIGLLILLFPIIRATITALKNYYYDTSFFITNKIPRSRGVWRF